METAENIVDYKVLYDQLHLRYDELEAQFTNLTHQLAQMKKMIFGSRHERFVPTDGNNPSLQLTLNLDAETIATCKITDVKEVTVTRTKTEVAFNKPKPHPGRMKLPEHLRRETVILMPDCDVTGLKKIGEEITEILDFTPGEFYVKQYIRPKFVRPVSDTNDTVITASLPGRIMEKCMAGEGLLAQITVDKYVDHLPLDRQLKRFQRAGITIPQSTICGWVKLVLMHLVALYELHKQYVLACRYLHVDETTIQVLDEDKKGKTHRGYYWLYFNSEQKLVLFDYQPGRDSDGPDNILKDFQGHLQTDGYAAYDHFDKRPGIILMGCMAHARRKFYDAQDKDRERCEYALIMFGQLYALERRMEDEGLDKEEVLKLRQYEAVPVLKTLKEWMLKELPKILPTSPVGKAMSYFLKRYDKLIVYTTNADLRIDNNRVENAVRPVALGRKNYLFAGSHDAAQRAAMIYSLFATCRYHQINPYDWLKDVMERMHLYTTTNLAELLPQNWKKPAVDMG